MPLNPANDVTLYCTSNEWFSVEPSLDGTLNLLSLFDNVFDLELVLEGTFVPDRVIDAVFNLNPVLTSDEVYIRYPRSNWVKWSTIGDFDFTQDRTNLAGEMPMDWAGDVWAIGKLDKILMVYGSGGITSLHSVDTVFGKVTLMRLGVLSKGSVLCQPSFHLFITSTGCLWKLSDKLEKLGYEEFLGGLDGPVISYDPVTKLAYICDDTDGYVFNCESNSLGKGPANITGVGYYDGVLYALSSDTVVNPDVNIVTHPTDFSNRNFKTITEIEVGGEFEDLEVGISFRNTSGVFTDPVWFTVTAEGRAFPNVFAKEFQFHLATEEDLSLDYLNVKGLFADFNPIDA